ncbi:MAG: type II secretion system F family protein, partial [Planctomycetales bacterium]|nr:type II secretion system F family protein [Planctomycetales bacterium]
RDRAVLYWAPFRQVARPLMTGRFCRMLAVMLQSGVPILEGLRLAKRLMTNTLFRELLEGMEESVVSGKSLSAALESAEIIPGSAREMIATAERTGNLTEVAAMLGEYYEEEAESRLRQLVRLLEPAITVGMGLVIAVVVLAVMLPIFDLSSFVGGAGGGR